MTIFNNKAEMLQSHAPKKVGGKDDFISKSIEICLYIDHSSYIALEHTIHKRINSTCHKYVTDVVVAIKDAEEYKRFVFLVSSLQDAEKLRKTLVELTKYIEQRRTHNKAFIF